MVFVYARSSSDFVLLWTYFDMQGILEFFFNRRRAFRVAMLSPSRRDKKMQIEDVGFVVETATTDTTKS